MGRLRAEIFDTRRTTLVSRPDGIAVPASAYYHVSVATEPSQDRNVTAVDMPKVLLPRERDLSARDPSYCLY
jgi:DNA/RNA endonuclease G (NUC1)